MPSRPLFIVVAAGRRRRSASLRGRADLDDRLAPMAGLVAAFIFAAQMLNFPVLPGVSGHLVGGALAAMLVGPWVAALCVSVVLIVQALVFADGGLTALGLNITNMALVTTAVAYLVIVALLRVLPRTAAGLAVTAFVASVVSVVVAALAFVAQYWLGGAVTLEAGSGRLAATMAGVHVLIGVGEGVITAIDGGDGGAGRGPTWCTRCGPAAGGRRRGRWRREVRREAARRFLVGGLVVALVLAGLVSPFASGEPGRAGARPALRVHFDEEGEVVGGTCPAQAEEEHGLADSPLADYGVAGSGPRGLATGLSGVIGVLITLLVGGGLFWLLRRARPRCRPRVRAAARSRRRRRAGQR